MKTNHSFLRLLADRRAPEKSHPDVATLHGFGDDGPVDGAFLSTEGPPSSTGGNPSI